MFKTEENLQTGKQVSNIKELHGLRTRPTKL